MPLQESIIDPQLQHALNISHYECVLCIDSHGPLAIEEEPAMPVLATASDMDVLEEEKKKDNECYECESDGVDTVRGSPVSVTVSAKRKSFRVCGTPFAGGKYCTLKLGHLSVHEGCDSDLGCRSRLCVNRYGSFGKLSRLV